MVMLCFEDTVGEPVINGQKVRFLYRRGGLYEVNPESPWACHFRPVTDAEAANTEANRDEATRPSEYLEPKVRETPVDDLMSKFRIG